MRVYLFRLLISLDQFFNALLGPILNRLFNASKSRFGYPDETISSVLGKMQTRGEGNKAARVLSSLLNKLDKNHVEDSIEQDEGSR